MSSSSSPLLASIRNRDSPAGIVDAIVAIWNILDVVATGFFLNALRATEPPWNATFMYGMILSKSLAATPPLLKSSIPLADATAELYMSSACCLSVISDMLLIPSSFNELFIDLWNIPSLNISSLYSDIFLRVIALKKPLVLSLTFAGIILSVKLPSRESFLSLPCELRKSIAPPYS